MAKVPTLGTGAASYSYTAATVVADERLVKAEAQAAVLVVNGGDTRRIHI